MSAVLSLIAGFVVIQITAGQVSDKQMICQQIENLFHNECRSGLMTSLKLQGPAGKRGREGPPGNRGLPGPQGVPGVCDYQIVDELVRRAVDEKESQMRREMTEQLAGMKASMREYVTNLTISKSKEEQRTTSSSCPSDYNGIAYNGSCLWAEDAPKATTRAVAMQTCNYRTRSKLPEIYGEIEYLQIMQYLRSKIPSGRTDIHTWIGMTRDLLTNKAVLSNGEKAPYTKPRSSGVEWTRAEARRTHAYLIARSSSSNSDNGMGSIWPSYDFSPNSKIVLCQKI